MTAPVVSVESGERIFQALLLMLGGNIHHILVTEEGKPKGVLTSHDLMLLQGKSPLSLARHIEQQQTIEDLAVAQKRIGDLLPLLMREGARASHITRVVAELNDRLIAEILQLGEAKLGPPPVPYCWVVLGSEERREQTFKTDQDNALIYADPEEEDRARPAEYFKALAVFAQEALEKCGYPPCPGGWMASNPRWRLPLSAWKVLFEQWIGEAEYHSVKDALILLDMRPVAGDFRLHEQLAMRNAEQLKTASFFKSILALISLGRKPPLGSSGRSSSSVVVNTRKSWTSRSTAPGPSSRPRACVPSMPAWLRQTQWIACRHCKPQAIWMQRCLRNCRRPSSFPLCCDSKTSCSRRERASL